MDYLIPMWAHQKEALAKAADLNEFALFFEQGTGKTSTTVNMLRQKYVKHGKILPTLILCPPIVIENWRREFAMHSKVVKNVVCLTGPGKKRAETIMKHVGKPAILVTNYEALLMKPVAAALEKFSPQVLVADESQRLKDLKSQRTKAAVKLAAATLYRFILSGTPILNSPMDIFAQFLVLDKGDTFGRNFFMFRAKYFVDKNASMPRDRYFPDWRIKDGAAEDINRLIAKKSMRVLKADCLDLPPLVRETVFVELSTEQERLYRQMKTDLITYINDKACVAQLAITKALRLMQIISGFIVVEGETKDAAPTKMQVVIKDNPRALALKELLEGIAHRERCIVWAVFAQDYATIRAVCSDLSLAYVELTGEVTQAQKMAAVDRFAKDPTCRVLIGNPSSGGVGINLVSASYAIFYSRNFSLEQDLQAEARNHRGGSEQHEKITRIDIVAKDTLDEVVVAALASKGNVAEQILGELKRA